MLPVTTPVNLLPSCITHNISSKMTLQISCLILLSVLVLNIDDAMVHGQCTEDQSSFLLQLKQSFVTFSSPPYSNSRLLSWSSNSDCCSWPGISCDGDGLVTRLDLSEESISGKIENTSSLFKLIHLESLNLAYNFFSANPVPSGFDQLHNLRHLNLSNSGFTGQIPLGVAYMKRLVSLDLSTIFGEPLKLEDPDLRTLLGNLPELRELYLDGVNLSLNGSEWCEAISSSVPNLQVLSLIDCHLSGPLKSSLLKLSALSELRLDQNNIAEVPEFFGNFSNLTFLSMSNCGFSGSIPPSITNLTQLQQLDISSNNFIGSIPPSITNLTQLQQLDISSNNFTGSIPPSITNLTQLQQLDISANNFTGSIPPSISNLTQLQQLDISSNNFTGSIPPSITNLTQLQQLDISVNNFIGSIPPSISNLTQLQQLDISANNFIGSIPPSISNLTQLQQLDISSNNFIGSIPPSISNLTQLQQLDISSNNFTRQIPYFGSSANLVHVNLANNGLTGSISSLPWDKQQKLARLILRNNSLNGTIPTILFTLPLLQNLDLAQNQFSDISQLHDLPNGSSSLLESLDLSNNVLEGPIPELFFRLSNLMTFALSSNKFNGTLSLQMFQKFGKLDSLDLSNNNLWIKTSGIDPSLFPQLSVLYLGSCNLRVFPDFLRNQLSLMSLDLSNNQIRGKIPDWISNIAFLNLSSNWLQGKIPILAPHALVLDYSNNMLTSIPVDIGSYLSQALFFSLSHNNLSGEIPMSICDAQNLQVLDFSDNDLGGMIPQCISRNLAQCSVLNLRNNNFHGTMPKGFAKGCILRTLDLNGNRVEGEVSKSLANCTWLEVLDLGNNQINGTFPSWLGDLSYLRVLVLRSNKLHGSIEVAKPNDTFRLLQIIDLSSNYFTGNLPSELFLRWEGMMIHKSESKHLEYVFGSVQHYSLDYQDSVTVSNKGMQMELVKILTIFTSIDLSNNQFEGEIPQVIGKLAALYVLNLSRNLLTGTIPSSLGKLTNLESLDLSVNKLNGEIPMQLADLTFLSVLNLSFNNLVGRIPTDRQFKTFTDASFSGNDGLCGFPLFKNCTVMPPSTASKNNRSCKMSFSNTCLDGDSVQLITATLGYGVGIGISIWIVVLSKTCNQLCVTISKKILNRVGR